MNTLKFILTLSLILVSADFAYRAIVDHAYGHNWKADLDEDEIILCVKGSVVNASDTGIICHIYTDLTEANYRNLKNDGSFFDINDSFKMDLID